LFDGVLFGFRMEMKIKANERERERDKWFRRVSQT